MNTLESLLEEYGESHTHMVNKLIHWIAVPAIVWSVVALLWSIPFPSMLEFPGIPVNWANRCAGGRPGLLVPTFREAWAWSVVVQFAGDSSHRANA